MSKQQASKGQFFLLGAIILAIMFFAGLLMVSPPEVPVTENLDFLADNVKEELSKAFNLGLERGGGPDELEDFTRFAYNTLAEKFIDFKTFWVTAKAGENTALLVSVGNFLDEDQRVTITISDARELGLSPLPETSSYYGRTISFQFGGGGGSGGGGVVGRGGCNYNGFCEGGESIICPDCYCGDGICSIGEGCDCTIDCGPCGGSTCGNGVIEAGEECDDGNTESGDGCSSECKKEECGNNICDAGETCSSCPQDCGECPPEVCGDNTCKGGELCSTCSADCGFCPPVTKTLIVEYNSTNSTTFFPVSDKYQIEIWWADEYRKFVWLREKANMFADITLSREGDIIRTEVER